MGPRSKAKMPSGIPGPDLSLHTIMPKQFRAVLGSAPVPITPANHVRTPEAPGMSTEELKAWARRYAEWRRARGIHPEGSGWNGK